MHNYKQHINAKAVVELYHFVMTLQWKAQCCIDQLRKYVTTRWRKRYSTVKPGKMKYYISDVLHCEEKVVRKRLGLKTSLVWFTLHCINTGKTSIVAILVAQWAKHPHWKRENSSFLFIAGTDDEEEEVVKPSHCQLPPALPVISPLPPLLQDSVAVIGGPRKPYLVTTWGKLGTSWGLLLLLLENAK